MIQSPMFQVGEGDISDKLVIYPNPTSHTIHFSAEATDVRLYDMAGRWVTLPSSEVPITQLNISTVPPGVYKLTLRTVEGHYLH
jgi:hypothetical protein